MDASYESDSDFYGETETVTRLGERVRLAIEETTELAVRCSVAQNTATRKHVSERQLHNPFAGMVCAWQIGETVDNFIHRLPPATTVMDERTPWIYICNPFIERKTKPDSENQTVSVCGDEGPEAEGSHTLIFVDGARERLDLLGSFLGGISQIGAPRGAAIRDAEVARLAATNDILGLAGHLGVTCGKWMLFVNSNRVNKVWGAVARATHRGELGIAAKVAPRDPRVNMRDEATRDRLICIYTSDFRDADDVARVLRRLESLHLVQRQKGRAIYYKCDAYTYLGISSKNPWGLRASLFSSNEIFGRIYGEQD